MSKKPNKPPAKPGKPSPKPPRRQGGPTKPIFGDNDDED